MLHLVNLLKIKVSLSKVQEDVLKFSVFVCANAQSKEKSGERDFLRIQLVPWNMCHLEVVSRKPVSGLLASKVAAA